MLLPNVREDEAYNQKYLKKDDKTFLLGYDFAVEKVLGMFFGNLDCYNLTADDDDIDLGRILTNHPELTVTLEECMREHFELNRTELVVSMIDGMDEDEYEARRAEVDAKRGQ